MEEAIESMYFPHKARMKRIAFLDEQRHNTKRWQLRRRRYLLRQIHREAVEGYWTAENPESETMYKVLMERT